MFHVATVLYFVVLNLGLLALVASTSFDYNNQDEWPVFPESRCGGMEQSPIDIDTNAALPNSEIVRIPLKFHNYDKPIAGTLKNIGSTVEFVPESGASMAVSNHMGTYDLQKIQIRWGTTDDGGSEHRLNGAQHAAEIQLIHLKQGVTPESPEATARDAYSIVSVFADVTTSDASTVWDEFDPPPTGYLETESISDSNYQYDDLLPPLPATSSRPYYYYEGSFTTPLCTENVQWYVMKDTITIPTAFLDELRMVKTENGAPLTFNFRDLQALNARDVFKFP